jgi:uncharacterized protein YdeI (YjbR/CyaY-like superfamily)
MTRDPRIDEYIAAAAPFAQPILSHVRALAHHALPDASESIKWGMPHFMAGGKNVIGMAAFKAHASVMIHGEGARGEGMGSLGKLTTLADLPPDDELIARFQAGFAALGTPRKKGAPKPELPVPPELVAALAEDQAAQATFSGFAPSHRREYAEWIGEAKRPETRARRVAQAIVWLREGKHRNWKYERC